MVALEDDSDMITAALGTAVNDFAARGYRSLGVAPDGGDGVWKFLGALPLFDPPAKKKETAEVLADTSIAA
jgi:H+-transporting ATPase